MTSKRTAGTVDQPGVNRRAFLRGTAGLACMSILSGCSHSGPEVADSSSLTNPHLKEELPVVPGYQPGVASAWVPRGEREEFSSIFRKAVEAATDFSWLSSGDRVLLKLSLNSGNPYPATTDPWALWCMIEMLKEKGAGEIIVGDQSGMESVRWFEKNQRGSSRDLCQSAGLLKVIQETGATPCFFEERGYDGYIATSPSGTSHWERPLWVTSLVEEVDHIVYMTRVSSHALSDITSGMKIAVGFLREDSRRDFHRGGDNFYYMYEEINQVPEISSKLRLTVSSGRSVLSTLGPDDGHVTNPKHGLVIASQDVLSHELLSYAWLNWNREVETPAYSKATTGRVTRFRSGINKFLVWWVWKSQRGEETPEIPLWQPGNIYEHPSIVNYMRRKGGRPENIAWEQTNTGPDKAVVDYLTNELKA